MTNLLNSLGKYSVSSAGIERENVQEKLNKSKQVVSANVESNSAVKTMSGGASSDVMRKTIMLLPPLLITDRFIDSKIGSNEASSLLKKIANVGDGISHFLHLDGFTGEKLSKFLKENRFTKYFTNDYKAIPKASIAKSETMAEKYSKELAGHLASLKDNPEFSQLFGSGADALSEGAKKYIGSINPAKAAHETSRIIEVTDEILSKGVDSIKQGSMLSEPVNLSVLKNKLKAADSKMGETALGSALAKGTLRTKNLITFGGGLISLAFTANALIQAVKATKEAPKGEKKSTFMHVLSEQYIGLLLFQPSINLLYKVGGNKYRGMSVEAKKALANLVKNTNADETLTKEALKVAKMQRDLLIKGVNKDEVAKLAGKTVAEAKNIAKGLKSEADLKFWEKPLKAFGKLLTMGLDDMKKPKYGELPVLGKRKLPQLSLKGFVGGFARFAIIMFLIQPLLQKPVTKLCHKIFGEPKSYLAKQNKGKDDKANNTKVAENKTPQQNNAETNLIKKWTSLPDSSGLNNQAPVQNAVSQQNMLQMPNGKQNAVPTTVTQSNISASAPLSPLKNNENQIQEQNDVMAASKLKDKGKKTNDEECTYIPSIVVDNSYMQTQEQELNKQAKNILKSTDVRVNRISKLLNN